MTVSSNLLTLGMRSNPLSQNLPGLHLWPDFLDMELAGALLEYFTQQHAWPANSYEMAGRRFELPRLQTWHADPGVEYSYSNNLLVRREWSAPLAVLRIKIEHFLNQTYNAVLVNLYRNQDDYVGWHADDDLEMGPKPFITSVSFGATRTFAVKNQETGQIESVDLPPGSLLLMTPSFQQRYVHSIPRLAKPCGPRVNLTFRRVLPKPA